MDFSLTPEQTAFRDNLRAWLEATSTRIFGGELDAQGRSAETLIFGRDDSDWRKVLDYHRELNRAGYLALHWPKEWGGAGSGLVEQSIYQDEVLRLGLPLFGANQLAIDRIGPTLMMFGTERQKRRFLPPMLTGDEIWCQGYSEPNSGSDLASLQTRAVVEGDHFVINGQKIWTSLAHRAHWQVLLVRTNTEINKHRGISYLLVDLKTPGIMVRPLKQMTGESTFNEVFYDNVQVPRENLVGDLNEGWRISIATLMFQRLSAAIRHPVGRIVKQLIGLTRELDFDGVPACDHPYVRQRIAGFAIEAECLRLNRYRALTSQLKGRTPGAENSFGKLFGSELNMRVAMFAQELLGAHAMLESNGDASHSETWMRRALGAREFTIAGGTSEVQHNIIAERVLGLPKG